MKTITWNDIFIKRLFNGTIVNKEKQTFELPEGYGGSNNYARVIDMYRLLADYSHPVRLKIEMINEEGYFLAINEFLDYNGVGDTAEEALRALILIEVEA